MPQGPPFAQRSSSARPLIFASISFRVAKTFVISFAFAGVTVLTPNALAGSVVSCFLNVTSVKALHMRALFASVGFLFITDIEFLPSIKIATFGYKNLGLHQVIHF